MRGFPLLLATCLTVTYGYATQAAIASERARVIERLAVPDSAAPTAPVWNGGTMAPIVVLGTFPAVSGKAALQAPAERPRRAPVSGARAVRII